MHHRRIWLRHATRTAFNDWRGVCERHSGNTATSSGHVLSAMAAMLASLTRLFKEELLGLLLLLLLKGREQTQREKCGRHETEVAVFLVTWRCLWSSSPSSSLGRVDEAKGPLGEHWEWEQTWLWPSNDGGIAKGNLRSSQYYRPMDKTNVQQFMFIVWWYFSLFKYLLQTL